MNSSLYNRGMKAQGKAEGFDEVADQGTLDGQFGLHACQQPSERKGVGTFV